MLGASQEAGIAPGDARLARQAANRVYLLLEHCSQPESPGNLTKELI